MPHDHEDGAAAIRHANARIAALREKVAAEVAAEQDCLDVPIILYGIKQVSLDPQGFLRLKQQADEHEILSTTRLYTTIYERFDWAVVELLAIAEELYLHDGWRAFSEDEVVSIQARYPFLAHEPLELLLSAFAHAYVCGTFAHAYPDRLLQWFPTTARMHAQICTSDREDLSEDVIAMQLALVDVLMVPNALGWHDLVNRN